MEKRITCIFVNNQTRATIRKNLTKFLEKKRRRTNKNLLKNARRKENQIQTNYIRRITIIC
jgi:hypothetical protein